MSKIDEAIAEEIGVALRPTGDEELVRLIKQVAMLRWLLHSTSVLYGPAERHIERN